jgi:hypothetical protein
MSSRTFFAGTVGLTTSTLDHAPSCVTPTKSRNGSYGIFLRM